MHIQNVLVYHILSKLGIQIQTESARYSTVICGFFAEMFHNG